LVANILPERQSVGNTNGKLMPSESPPYGLLIGSFYQDALLYGLIALTEAKSQV